ncbi:MAG: protein phosphatase 2C domain-containing protein [Thermogutta sp.]|nr:protein phosphatase 2C domain-containing protein [Thermogutta sp.]
MGGTVMVQSLCWKVVGVSVIGTQHMAAGGRCEDGWSTVRRRYPDGRTILGVCVCDGAGSTSHGWLGAQIASRVVAAWLADNFDGALADPVEDNRWSISSVAKRAIRRVAEKAGLSIKDYACTMVALAVSSDGRWIAAHLGDGAIVGMFDGCLRLISSPRKGEFANETYFITDQDSVENIEFQSSAGFDIGEQGTAFALFTDGVEVTLVNRHTREVAPALRYMLGWLADHDEGEVAQDLEEQVKSVFQQHTSDDCTLALVAKANHQSDVDIISDSTR